MFANVVCNEDKKGCVMPFKNRPQEKIDSAIATIIALSRAEAYVDKEAERQAAMDKMLGIDRTKK
jgi:phage terminase large subunit-like protein